MHDDVRLVEARIDRFMRDRLPDALYSDARALTVSAWEVPGEPVPVNEALAATYTPVPAGWRWGRAWSTVWLHVTGEVPEQWRDASNTRTELVFDFGYNRSRPGFQAEGLAYLPDGTPLKAINPLNSYVPWDPEVRGHRIDLYIEAAANPDVAGDYTFEPTQLGDLATVPNEPLYALRQTEVALLNLDVWELTQDLWTLRGLLGELDGAHPRRHEILRAIEQALDAMNPDDVVGTARDGRAALAEVLAKPATASAHRIIATGHAHIDSAWLWPLRETVRKCARTFQNVIALMDEDPELIFSCSSAQQYQWVKDHHPQIYERLRDKVAEGRFVPVGGMWVESDTNMPGSEAMARQFIEGKLFFLEEFGVECEEAWLPDSFGYSAALPQIVAAAGERWFLTQKISWNQTNRMPHHTFWWEGIDGTRVFTHFPPADTYISDLSAMELLRAERQFAEKGRAHWSLLPFGWGDGGGGPTREMLATARRVANLEGLPQVSVGSARDFFTTAQDDYPDPPVWTGEMYLELHRGVLTSQARTKQGNRRNEVLLRTAEMWSAAATLRAGAPYPGDELREAWRTVLLLQFHDILPGSSISWVHRDAERMHGEVTDAVLALIARAHQALGLAGDTSVTSPLVINDSPFERRGVAGHAIGALAPAAAVTVYAAADGTVFDNAVICATVDSEGRIASLIGAADGREAIPAGEPAASFHLHRDLPNLWDAWDLDAHYRRDELELAPAVEQHTVRMSDRLGIETVHAVGASTIRHTVSLGPGDTAVRIDVEVDWHEREKILKLAFPCDVRADRVAAQTQFGHVFRPTHTNTSWDAARFEQCQHRFAHLDEGGYGVAIANDSTYGYDVSRHTRDDGGTTTTLRMSLLRAPLFPDPESDQGEHRMSFLISPGASIEDAVRLAYDLANPLIGVRPTGTAALSPLVTSSDPGVVIETVKLAHDGSGDLVVRLYESTGTSRVSEIGFDGDALRVVETDLLERPLSEQSTPGATVALPFRPFQLRTLRFVAPAAQ